MRVSTIVVFCFLALVSCKPKELEEGKWVLKSLFEKDVTSLKEPITLNLDLQKHEVAGFAGCNKYFGKFTTDKSSLKFQEIGSTKMFCQETMGTEMEFMTALEQVESFDIRDNTLLLLVDNKIILEFTK